MLSRRPFVYKRGAQVVSERTGRSIDTFTFHMDVKACVTIVKTLFTLVK